MIKARYLGIDTGPLQSCRVYKISTNCVGNRLVVSVRNEKRTYSCLEQFLKEWKVEAVYSGQSRA